MPLMIYDHMLLFLQNRILYCGGHNRDVASITVVSYYHSIGSQSVRHNFYTIFLTIETQFWMQIFFKLQWRLMWKLQDFISRTLSVSRQTQNQNILEFEVNNYFLWNLESALWFEASLGEAYKSLKFWNDLIESASWSGEFGTGALFLTSLFLMVVFPMLIISMLQYSYSLKFLKFKIPNGLKFLMVRNS